MRSSGELLAMAALAPRILAAALLEGDHLGAAALLDHLGGDAGAGNRRRAELRLSRRRASARRQAARSAGLALDPLDLDDLVLGDPVLLAAGLDDCEHRSGPVLDPGARTSGPASFSRIVWWLQALSAVTKRADPTARAVRPSLWPPPCGLSRIGRNQADRLAAPLLGSDPTYRAGRLPLGLPPTTSEPNDARNVRGGRSWRWAARHFSIGFACCWPRRPRSSRAQDYPTRPITLGGALPAGRRRRSDGAPGRRASSSSASARPSSSRTSRAPARSSRRATCRNPIRTATRC